MALLFLGHRLKKELERLQGKGKEISFYCGF
jgi:hypothetical protein